MISEAYIANRLFTGESWLQHHAVLVAGGIIQDIVPVSALPSSQHKVQFDNCMLAPAFIDLQIYGAGSKLFAEHPEVASLHSLVNYCKKGGAAYCMPTVATNTYPVIYKCIDVVKEYWNQGGTGILGLHLEGPWINPGKRGAHIEALIHVPSIRQAKELLEFGKDIIKIITLAPEVCSKEIIDLILSCEIVISAGHSNATYDEAKAGFTNGITTVTHLYNAMSPLQHRQPGLTGAAMDDKKVMASIIPDGYHVDYAAIRIAKEIMKERLFVITDAVTATKTGHYQHELTGDKYEAAGVLSGSALTMGKAIHNLVSFAGIELGEALRMCSLYPAQVIGMEKKLGRIEKGYMASMVILNENLEINQIIQ